MEHKDAKFEKNKEYYLLKRNGDIAKRTFVVEQVSHKKMLIKVSGGINGVFEIFTDRKNNDMINLGMQAPHYLNPSATDIIE